MELNIKRINDLLTEIYADSCNCRLKVKDHLKEDKNIFTHFDMIEKNVREIKKELEKI